MGAKLFASFEILCDLKNKNTMQFNHETFPQRVMKQWDIQRQNKLNLT